MRFLMASSTAMARTLGFAGDDVNEEGADVLRDRHVVVRCGQCCQVVVRGRLGPCGESVVSARDRSVVVLEAATEQLAGAFQALTTRGHGRDAHLRDLANATTTWAGGAGIKLHLAES